VKWQYVGMGRGSYNTGNTYSYVGQGCGAYEQAVVSTPVGWKIRPVCIGIAVLALVAVVVFVILPRPATTTPQPDFCQDAEGGGGSLSFTQRQYCCRKYQMFCPTQRPTQAPQTLPAPKTGECTFWGDPHVLTFDGGRPSFYGEGEWWVVKSSTVWIQSRFKGTKYTNGLAATRKVAVGGPFLRGHTIVVGALEEGPVTVDGQPVLTSFPSSYSMPGGLGRITYDSNGRIVDQATHIWEKRVVRMDLPLGVTLEVFRWTNYLDFRLTMTAQPNQDGCCGNFDGDAGNDSTRQVMNRMGARVEPGKNMFNHRTIVGWTDVEEKLLAMCPPAKLPNANAFCASLGAPTSVPVKSCKLDLCFGSNEHALRMTKSLGL